MQKNLDNFIAGDGCRNCGYIFYYHREYRLDKTWYNANNQRYICPCDNFEPEDNLKFLEMKYEQDS